MNELKVLFVAGFGPLTREPGEARRLYVETLGLPLEAMEDEPDYLHTGELGGTKHFALWPLAAAAESCFGTGEWPADRPVPQAWLEFEVEDVAQATEVLRGAGYELLVAREEPWGQTVARFLSPEGILTAVTHTPWMR